MQKEIKKLEFVQGIDFEFIDSLKNNAEKYLLFFDDSCEEIRNSKTIFDIATGRNRGLSTIYIKLNLFYESKLGRDVELQNAHLVLFKSPHDLMPLSMFSAQLRPRSELVGWYRDEMSVPYGHLLIDLFPRTDD